MTDEDKKGSQEMRHLGNLRPAKGSKRPRKRIGRGIGSGTGKTAGKGHKGLKARKGGKVRPGFEGGQMPLYMRLPKRGFKNPFRVEYNVINLDELKSFGPGANVDASALEKAGLLREPSLPVKLLGRGKVDQNLVVVVHKASKTAKAAVEGAGGKLTELGFVKRKALIKGKKQDKK
jgi:large subunit ribosomal protein L15